MSCVNDAKKEVPVTAACERALQDVTASTEKLHPTFKGAGSRKAPCMGSAPQHITHASHMQSRSAAPHPAQEEMPSSHAGATHQRTP